MSVPFSCQPTIFIVPIFRDYLSDYSTAYELHTMLCLASVYICMQALAILGTVLLSILAGALFGFWKGLIFVAITSTTGASACYFLSSSLGRPLAFWLWPSRMQHFRQEVSLPVSLLPGLLSTGNYPFLAWPSYAFSNLDL